MTLASKFIEVQTSGRNVIMDENLNRLFATLTSALNHELELYDEMERVLRSEREAIVGSSVGELVTSNRTKEEILLRLEAVDRSRRDILRHIALHLNTPPQGLTMTHLVSRFQGAERERLRGLQEELRLAAVRIRTLNHENRRLAETALAYARGWMNYFQSLLCPEAGYQENGRIQNRPVNGKLISRRG